MDALAGLLAQALTAWLPAQRWFAGKGRPVNRVEIAHVTPVADALGEGGAMGVLAFARVFFADGLPSECYQVPVGARRSLPAGLESAIIAKAGDLVVYDALADPELIAAVLAHPGGRGNQEAAPRTRMIGSEQTNTCVVIGERYILKVFRRIEAGVNPEAELQGVLARAGSRHVAPFFRAVEARLGGERVTLATLHGYVPRATDGWARAQASLRDLPAGSGGAAGDFTAEARSLGGALASVHADLARELGTSCLDQAALRGLAAALLARLDTALAAVPELAAHEPALRAVFGAVGAVGAVAAGTVAAVPVQRVHGDLHLGQTLRTGDGWLLIDFEGEPAVPLADRRVPQSPLRDVAGMLRSIDYAADVCLRERAPAPGQVRRWAARSQAAFCDGYAAAGGEDPRARRELLRVFQLEKAVYEAAYEARFRPGWADIPLRAIGRMLGHPTGE